MAVLLGCVLIMMALVLPEMRANAGPADVCPGLDSGKIDVSGEQTSITVTAPAGYLIDEYCVKAGSVQGGTGGPVIVAVNPPQKSVTITYPSGKAISHYSVSYVPISTPTTPPPTCTSNCTPPPSCTHDCTPPSSCTHDCTPPPSKHVTPAVHPTAKAGAEAVATYPLQPVKGGVTTEQVSDDAVLTPVRAALVMLGLLAFWFALSGRLPRVKRVKPSRRDS
jgi:hypothetical protein